MTENLTFFESVEDLEKLTGLSRDELWENGFDLDDMDWGFRSDNCYVKECKDEFGCSFWGYRDDEGTPEFIHTLLFLWMDSYCVGFRHTEHNGKHYYILYHS